MTTGIDMFSPGMVVASERLLASMSARRQKRLAFRSSMLV
jgi:hypothetical protein